MTTDTLDGAGPSRPRWPAGAWLAAVLLGLGLSFGAAFAPVQTGFLVPLAGVLGYLVWKFGVQRGTWFLFVASIPLRQPLGVDLVGTTTLFVSDALIGAQLLFLLPKMELRGLWRTSPVLRLGTLLSVLSVASLYTLLNPSEGLAQVQRVLGQVLVLVIARTLVTDADEARRTILAFLFGMIPAILFGFYQASIPVETWNYADWAEAPIAHDSEGRSHIRIFSTFNHTLRFSLALSTAFGLAIGLIAPTRRASLPAAGMAGLAAACNYFTYSIGGVLAMAAALVVGVVRGLGSRAWFVTPVLLVVLAVSAPNAVYWKASQMLAGDSTSSLSRLITYQRTAQVLADRPLTGLGWGGFGSTVLTDYRIARLESLSVGAENYFLQRGLALGFPGLLVAIALAIRFVRDLRSRRTPPDWPRGALICGAVAYGAQAMIIPAADHSTSYLLWMMLALAESGRVLGEERSA